MTKNQNMPYDKPLDPAIWATKIASAMNRGFQEAADLVTKFLEQGGDLAELRKHLCCAPQYWSLLLQLSKKLIIPELADKPMFVRCAAASLSLSDQKALITTGVDVLSVDGTGIRVRLSEMTRDQRRMVFASDHVRSISEQAAWLKADSEKKAAAREVEAKRQVELMNRPWDVVKSGSTLVLVVNRACTLTKEDVRRVFVQMCPAYAPVLDALDKLPR